MVLVVQRGEVADVDAGQRERATLLQAGQGDGDQLTGWREEDRRVERPRGRVRGGERPRPA
jgi:hypothetical protein